MNSIRGCDICTESMPSAEAGSTYRPMALGKTANISMVPPAGKENAYPPCRVATGGLNDPLMAANRSGVYGLHHAGQHDAGRDGAFKSAPKST